MSKYRIVGLGIGVLAILAAFGIVMWQTANMSTGNVAFAQSATATPTPAAGTTPTPDKQPQQQAQSEIGDTFWALLADKLGVDVDDLKADAVEARKEMIDQAVTDGRATQEQADAIKENITANSLIAPIQLGRTGSRPGGNQPGGNPPNNQQKPGQGGPFGGFGNGLPGRGFGGGFGGMFGRGMMGGMLDTLNAVATTLKLEPQALVEQLSQGKSLAEIAEAQGVEESAVKQAIIDQLAAQIDEQLKLGLISEVQANQLKAKLTPDSIDLSRGFRFNFNLTVPGQDSSQLFPEMDWGQAFGNLPADGSMPFGDVFGSVFGTTPNGGTFTIPPGSIQTQ